MKFNTIEQAIEAVGRGELVVVVDDTDRENEGDLIMAASQVTPAKIGFMVRHTSGILCVPMDGDRAERLSLSPMVANNLDPMRTAFTVSVDRVSGMATGISAEERANTARSLADDAAQASDFLRPGHMFPLIARAGGVLTRSGHTEAGTDLARLAGLPAVGVLAEIVDDQGGLQRLPQLLHFAAEHALKIISIEDLIEYRIRTERFVERTGTREITFGDLQAAVHTYRTPFDPMEHIVVVIGELGSGEAVPCRIRREQPIADLAARAQGAGTWLESALEAFSQRGRGVLIMVRHPVADDVHVLDEQRVEAGEQGMQEQHNSARQRMQRWREVGVGAQILRHVGVRSIVLLAAHKQRYVGLRGFGIEIADTLLIEE